MKYTINELANSKGVSQPVREALLHMEAELEATNKQVEILSDSLAESRREVAALKAVQEPIGYLFQHEETGLTTVVDVQQVEWGFEKNNPRHQKIGPVYTTPPAAQRPDVDALVALARADEREACAKICQQQSELQLDERVMRGIDACTDAIRARGNT
jgi:hypothetical protein